MSAACIQDGFAKLKIQKERSVTMLERWLDEKPKDTFFSGLNLCQDSSEGDQKARRSCTATEKA